MLLIRNRDELRSHLKNRIQMLEAQLKSPYTKTCLEAHGLAMRMEGFAEALELIEAWEMFGPEGSFEHAECRECLVEQDLLWGLCEDCRSAEDEE